MDNENITAEEVELTPSYNLAVILLLIGIALTLGKNIFGLVVMLFALFLLIQTTLIKLKFTKTALDIYRQQTKIRSFPYSEWENWKIFFPSIPVLFYFKEVKSIHFLPIIFNSIQLQSCLKKYCSYSQNIKTKDTINN
jgi:hypothetical protein